ncbi:MAG: MgtC/SapB family protein [Lewinellaceae bacterium]|nr:MgtC/SapB family protein [Saprospiraceae bacterium]MCB9330148.1 MgtC/SapB family protein [Lewinellaceae bacterium]
MGNSDFAILGIALGLGLLAGLQRERLHSRVAGIRTFALITLFGSISGMIGRHFDSDWVVAAGALSVAILLGVANYLKTLQPEPDIGQTTEMAALVMFGVGALLVFVDPLIGVVVGATVALLLYLKHYLSDFAERLGEKDLKAIMLFTAISLIILPVLPDRDFGPFSVFNLRDIWLMVVLIVGLSLAGFFAYKWLGTTTGTALSGFFAGLISSTAATVSYARQTKQKERAVRLAAFVIMAASTVSFLRILVEISVVTPQNFAEVAPPLAAIMAFMALLSVGLFLYKKKETSSYEEPENPAQFKTALVFALLYALILFAVAAVKEYFGNVGLYAVSAISGLTDIDAITLSLSNMINNGSIEANGGWRFILVAAMANLVFKGSLVAVIGHRSLLRLIAPVFGLVLVAGALVLWLW